jgi:hypothetical protein
MWPPFFELHNGPWQTSGHSERPDTRAIEAPSRCTVRKSPCKTGGIHTRPSQCCRTYLEAALRQIDGKNVNVGHMLLLLRRTARRSGIIRCRTKGASTPSVQSLTSLRSRALPTRLYGPSTGGRGVCGGAPVTCLFSKQTQLSTALRLFCNSRDVGCDCARFRGGAFFRAPGGSSQLCRRLRRPRHPLGRLLLGRCATSRSLRSCLARSLRCAGSFDRLLGGLRII